MSSSLKENGKMGVVFTSRLDASGTRQLEQVESALFSNVDMQFYDKNGNIHPSFHKYKGKKFSVRFTISNPNPEDSSRLETFCGELMQTCYIGELPAVTTETLLKSEKMSKGIMKKWGEMCGLSGCEESDWTNKTKYCSFLAFCCPDMDMADLVVTQGSLPIWMAADIMETRPWSFPKLLEVRKLVHTVLKGEEISPENLEDVPQGVLEAAEIMSKCLREQRMVEVESPMFDIYYEWIDTMFIKMSTEWQATGKRGLKFYPEYQRQLRDVTNGGYIMFEMITLDKGLTLTKQVRDTFLFKSLMIAHTRHMEAVNDVMSYRKEIELKENTSCSTVEMYYKRNGHSLKEALEEATDVVNSTVEQVTCFGNLLIEFYAGTKEWKNVKECVDTCRRLMHGHVQWCAYATRYHPGMVYDCIVHIDD